MRTLLSVLRRSKQAQKSDDRFAFADFIKKIRYQEDNISVFVNVNFLSLSLTNKNFISEKNQGFVGSSIAMVYGN